MDSLAFDAEKPEKLPIPMPSERAATSRWVTCLIYGLKVKKFEFGGPPPFSGAGELIT